MPENKGLQQPTRYRHFSRDLTEIPSRNWDEFMTRARPESEPPTPTEKQRSRGMMGTRQKDR